MRIQVAGGGVEAFKAELVPSPIGEVLQHLQMVIEQLPPLGGECTHADSEQARAQLDRLTADHAAAATSADAFCSPSRQGAPKLDPKHRRGAREVSCV